jgi:hypothetical protein
LASVSPDETLVAIVEPKSIATTCSRVSASNRIGTKLAGNMEFAMEKTNASKSLLVAIAMVLLAGAIGFFLIGGKESVHARADKGVTTETRAAAAAQVIPTEPKLRVEPK